MPDHAGFGNQLGFPAFTRKAGYECNTSGTCHTRTLEHASGRFIRLRSIKRDMASGAPCHTPLPTFLDAHEKVNNYWLALSTYTA